MTKNMKNETSDQSELKSSTALQIAAVLIRIQGLVFLIWGIESTVRLWSVVPFYSAEKLREFSWLYWLFFPAYEFAVGLTFLVAAPLLARVASVGLNKRATSGVSPRACP
jgi:hypothetical protein